ncbi:hypothetical protein ACWENQ_08430 [Nonomuraea sp. NPDC004354]
MSFAQPAAPSSDFKIADYVGHLFLIYPREQRHGVITSNGPADPIVADVVLLTDPAGPRAETNVLIFQKVLIGSLKNSIGRDPVLGRLGRGIAKPGQTAPYVLDQFNDADAAYATQYLNGVGGNPFPAFTPAAPAPALAPAAVPVPVPAAVPAPAPVPVAQAPVAAAPVAPVAVPVPAAAPVPAAPQVAANQAEALAAMQALGMQAPPPAPAA